MEAACKASRCTSVVHEGHIRRSALIVLCIISLIACVGTYIYFHRGRNDSDSRTLCTSVVRQIGLMCIAYANENGGVLPPNVFAFYEEQKATAFEIACPTFRASVHEGNGKDGSNVAKISLMSFVYLGGTRPGSDLSRRVILYEPLTNHGSGIHVLYDTGEVEWIPSERVSMFLQKLADRPGTSETGTK